MTLEEFLQTAKGIADTQNLAKFAYGAKQLPHISTPREPEKWWERYNNFCKMVRLIELLSFGRELTIADGGIDEDGNPLEDKRKDKAV